MVINSTQFTYGSIFTLTPADCLNADLYATKPKNVYPETVRWIEMNTINFIMFELLLC